MTVIMDSDNGNDYYDDDNDDVNENYDGDDVMKMKIIKLYLANPYFKNNPCVP